MVIVFDGHLQGKRGLLITAEQRAAESEAAHQYLHDGPGSQSRIVRLGFRDDDPTVTATMVLSSFLNRFFNLGLTAGRIFVPAWEDKGHLQHNLVANAFGMNAKEASTDEGLTRYLTYTRVENGKSTSPREVPILKPEWIGNKLRALACFQSQFLPATGCQEHFIGRSLREYYL